MGGHEKIVTSNSRMTISIGVGDAYGRGEHGVVGPTTTTSICTRKATAGGSAICDMVGTPFALCITMAGDGAGGGDGGDTCNTGAYITIAGATGNIGGGTWCRLTSVRAATTTLVSIVFSSARRRSATAGSRVHFRLQAQRTGAQASSTSTSVRPRFDTTGIRAKSGALSPRR